MLALARLVAANPATRHAEIVVPSSHAADCVVDPASSKARERRFDGKEDDHLGLRSSLRQLCAPRQLSRHSLGTH